MDRGAEELIRVPEGKYAFLEAFSDEVPPGVSLVDEIVFEGMPQQHDLDHANESHEEDQEQIAEYNIPIPCIFRHNRSNIAKQRLR
jgi:hypothetical protein